MPKYLPICLNLNGRAVTVIGAGKVASERIPELLECGARITVVSPAVSERIRAAGDAGRLTLHQRPWQPGDAGGAFLVVVATNDPAVNAAVYDEASAGGQLVNVCDDPEHCNYIFASKIDRGPLTVSIFTHGAAPAFSRRVRRELEAWLGPEYGQLAELLSEIRPTVKALEKLGQGDRQRIFERIVYSEALLLFREGRPAEARALAEQAIRDGVAEAGAGSTSIPV